MKYFLIILIMLLAAFGCEKVKSSPVTIAQNTSKVTKSEQTNYQTLFNNNKAFISYGFDYPVGKPNAKGYYNAQKFQENNHLGDDWNGVNGGNSDLGDSVYAISNGYVTVAKDYKGGWGNVIRIVHLYKNNFYESLYAHCDTMLVKPNSFINKGDKIATIGNCNGAYLAHLHFEIRNVVDMPLGGGYSTTTSGYLNPTEFIKKNRK